MRLFLKAVMAFTVTALMSVTALAQGAPLVVLTKDNTVILNDQVDGESVKDVIQKARQLDATLPSGYPINLFLYTPGGSIQDGLELIEALRSLNRPVNTVTMFAASMGWQIAQQLGNRMILSQGVLMSHKAKGGFFGEFGDGQSQIDSRYALWMERILDMDKMTVDRTKGKQTMESYRKQYENELWINGAKAVEMGYADEVVSAKCDDSLNGTFSKTFYMFGITINVVFSECPLITTPLDVTFQMQTNKGFMTYTDFINKGGLISGNAYDTPLYFTGEREFLDKAMEAVSKFKKEYEEKRRTVIRSY